MNFSTILAMAAPPGEGGGSMWSTLAMFAAIIGIMYFMVIRPQQKRMKEQQAMLAGVKRGDTVVLTGGMHGKVFEVQDKTVMVEVAKNTVITFDKAAVQGITSKAE